MFSIYDVVNGNKPEAERWIICRDPLSGYSVWDRWSVKTGPLFTGDKRACEAYVDQKLVDEVDKHKD